MFYAHSKAVLERILNSTPDPRKNGRKTKACATRRVLGVTSWSQMESLEARVLMSGSILEPVRHAGVHHEETAATILTGRVTAAEPELSARNANLFKDPGALNGVKRPLIQGPRTHQTGNGGVSSATNATPGTGSTTTGGTTTATPSGRVPYGATYQDTSEFMLGDVWVTVVLLESNGQVDAQTENWTSTEISQVKSEVLEGLTWWEDTLAAQNSKHDLNFFVDFTYADTPVQTKYEPIKRPYTDQTLWVGDFVNSVGYNSSTSMFTNMDKWNHDKRVQHSTDWAYTIFVADSSADTDGMFADGYFAYAYFGGPFAIMTYDNENWGISRMGQVLAHETGHIFYTLDEYSGGNSYTETSGYYNTQNLNAATGNPNPSSRVASIMAEYTLQNLAYPNHTSSPSSLKMLGWQDSDGDGIFNVLDVPLTLTGSGGYNASTGKYDFTGSSAVQTLTNLNTRSARHNITTNTIDHLQYRLDGGAWTNGSTYYGQFSTSVSQSVPISTTGTHTVEFRTIVDETGLTSNIWSQTFSAAAPQAGFTVTPTSGLQTGESGSAASFSVVLTKQPTANVTISIVSSDTTEGVVSTPALTFTPTNWNTAQSVTVTGVNDAVYDGNVAYSIITGPAVSTDAAYNGLNPSDVAVVNNDNDVAPGVTVTPTSGLTVSEAGVSASFSIVLKSQPTANVVIGVASSDTTEGTVSVNSVTFTPLNWNVAQTVTVKGVDDTVIDGNVTFSIVTGNTQSADALYNNVGVSDVAITNQDNDKALRGKKGPSKDTSTSITKGNSRVSGSPEAIEVLGPAFTGPLMWSRNTPAANPFRGVDLASVLQDQRETLTPWQAITEEVSLTSID